MIRATTPLPRRPSAEPELLDLMLRVLRNAPPFRSTEAVSLVQMHAPEALGVDIRNMLAPPYFRLTESGWVCCWRLG